MDMFWPWTHNLNTHNQQQTSVILCLPANEVAGKTVQKGTLASRVHHVHPSVYKCQLGAARANSLCSSQTPSSGSTAGGLLAQRTLSVDGDLSVK